MTRLVRRPLGRTGLNVSPLGFGSFKIGRNQGIKYPQAYDLPDDAETAALLDGILELGINLIDTAPAYGLAEERLGRHLAGRRDEFVLSSKVGEIFEEGVSRYDFSREGMLRSVEASLRKLKTDALDLLLIHSYGDDLQILQQTDAVDVLEDLKQRGLARGIGLSGKTVAGAKAALQWADAIMVEYHAEDESHAGVMETAHARGVGVLVKKGLASGRLPVQQAIAFVLENEAVDSLVLGGLNAEHFRENCRIAAGVCRPGAK